MNQIDLKGRRAVVTGAAQGIGLSITQRLLASGARVCLWDQDATLLEETCEVLAESPVLSEVVDVTDADAVAAAAQRTATDLGGIDILVNNAGIAGPTVPLWEYPVSDWQHVIDVDLNAVYYCCRAVIPMMRDQDYGRVVNVASIAGKEGNPNETADLNIAVNCISPAAARTRIFDQISQQHIDYMLSKIPRGRFVLVEEIAAMVAWMVSEENSFTTGAAFDLSGGRATY